MSINTPEATTCKILSLRHDRPIVSAITKNIPNFGIGMSINTAAINHCPGGCAYCFCALNAKTETVSIRRLSTKGGMDRVVRTIEIVKPDVITIAEKIELGFDSKAIEDIRALRNLIDPNITIIASTKFPGVYKDLDLPNTHLVVTLSNPNHKGMEPHILPVEKRVEGILEAVNNSKYLKVGVRVLICDVSEIYALYQLVKPIRDKIDILWVDFMRCAAKDFPKLYQRMHTFTNFNNYESHYKYGYTLMECFIHDTIATFADLNPVYDRLPLKIARKCEKAGIKVVKYHQPSMCYIRADNVRCAEGACNKNSLVCSGISPRTFKLCKNMSNMTPAQLKETRDMWDWIYKVKAFAYGIRFKNKPNDRIVQIRRLLHSL